MRGVKLVMQVFLPYADTVNSLYALDDARLRKQRVEARQLIDTILDRPTASGKPRKGWYNHPAAVMFRQYVPYLVTYYNLSLIVYEERGGKNIKLQPEPITDEVEIPHWFGDSVIHASHRSRLLFKGKVDVLAERIRLFTGKRAANAWLAKNKFPPLNMFRQGEYEAVSSLLDEMNAPVANVKNHYASFGWTEPDNIEYAWPGETPAEPTRTIR